MPDTTSQPDPLNDPASTLPDPIWGRWHDWTPACLVLRIALALLLMVSGSEKFRSDSIPATYSLENWYGTPEQKTAGTSRMVKTVSVPFRYSGLDNEATFNARICNTIAHLFYGFGLVLPWVMLVSGFLIFIGLFSKVAHFAGAMVWISLMAGQTILPEYSVVQMLLMFAALHGFALTLLRHNRLALTSF